MAKDEHKSLAIPLMAKDEDKSLVIPLQVVVQLAVIMVVHKSMVQKHLELEPVVAAEAAMLKMAVPLVAEEVAQFPQLLRFRLPASAQSVNLLVASLAAYQEVVSKEPSVVEAL